MTAADLIARRVRKGHNPADSEALLADLCARHDGDNLAAALVYQAFATPRQADLFIAARATAA